jgi:hypothetical protein
MKGYFVRFRTPSRRSGNACFGTNKEIVEQFIIATGAAKRQGHSIYGIFAVRNYHDHVPEPLALES